MKDLTESHQMMTSAQVVEMSVNTNNSPSQGYATNPDDHSNHNMYEILFYFKMFWMTSEGVVCKSF